ncbi:unnamed protein product [Brachionus calyciflorus]|uniref:FHF complex subunit HOOK-interacting protein C-terminal domain-containing protein n=1 Tax=Brachionus calyciflorus TaxID=104777 RepID=A0A813N9C4_9BILA|nr:unnamed protein product [Brachionus calyciflorus]
MFSFNISNTSVNSKSKNINQSSTPSPRNEQQVSFEVFKDHWKQVLIIFNKSLINDDDIQIVKNNLTQMICLLINELNIVTNQNLKLTTNVNYESSIELKQKSHGQVWDYLFANNIFETIYLWTLSYPEYLTDLKYEQLKYYEVLINQMQINEQTNLILYNQVHRPLFSLINHCSSHNSELIERLMISVLNQLCVCMCKNSNLLNIFFENASNSQMFINNGLNELVLERTVYSNEQKYKSANSAKSFIFTLLIPYIHREGSYGQQARDSLLMIMQLSSRNSNLAKYIVYNTDFCPILATGLSGLYSELPQKLDFADNIEDIRYLQKEDIINIISLNKFINSLEFCNNVLQVSHSLIANQLLQYVYYGFLIPVIAPALTQNNVEEIIAATLYLELFLRTINETNLLKIFLKFILHSKFDERITLLDTLIHRINTNNKLCLVTLMFFYTMIDLNSEDVMYKLILTHLMPCKHLMKSQIVTLKQTSHEINGFNAQTFLSLATDFTDPDKNNNSMINGLEKTNQILIPYNFSTLNNSSPLYRWLCTMFPIDDLAIFLSFLDSMNFNFVEYLKDSRSGILLSTQKSHKWSSHYDFVSNLNNLNSTKIIDENQFFQPSQELEYDPEEYLFNLNISSGSLNDNNPKSTRTTVNLFAKEIQSDHDGFDFDMLSLTSSNKNKSENRKNKSKSSRTSEKIKKTKPRKNRASDFYVLSFDNELSETSSSSSECSISENENLEEPVIEEDFDEDDDLTATSISSTTTLNHESIITPNLVETQCQYREQLVDFLFNNEENNKICLNSNLDNFLNSIDSFFSSNLIKDSQRVLIESEIARKSNKLDDLCDQILEIYNDIFSPRKPIEVKNEEKIVNESKNELPTAVNGLTTFPSYVNDSMNSSSYSSNTNNQTFDSGVESTNSAGKENDLGPFLCALLNRLDHMLTNNLQINFMITGIFARLAYYPQLLLRSYLLNHNLVLQPNVKSLIQILGNVKFKIEACSKTYNNFALLYLKAKIFLVKRLIDSNKKNTINQNTNGPKDRLSNLSSSSLNNGQILNGHNNDRNTKSKKKFSMETILNIFFKSSNDELRNNGSHQDNYIEASFQSDSSKFNSSKNLTSRSDYDFGRIGSQTEEIYLKEMIGGDFLITDNDWEDMRSRNIAFSAVIFDEFVKELAAICQEHSVLTQENFI